LVVIHKSNDKVRIVPVLDKAPRRKDVLGSGGIAPLSLQLGTRGRWVVSFTPWSLYPRVKSPCYPLDRLSGPQTQSGRGVEEWSLSLPLPGIEPCLPTRNLVSILTEPLQPLWRFWKRGPQNILSAWNRETESSRALFGLWQAHIL